MPDLFEQGRSVTGVEGRNADWRATVRALLRRLPVVFVCVLITAGSALVFSLLQTNQYTAEASILFRDPGFDQRLFGGRVLGSIDPDREAATNIQLASLDAVADLTAEDLEAGLDGEAVSAMVEVESDGRSDLATISATDTDPEFASLVANTFAKNYIAFRRDADRDKVRQARRLVEAELKGLPLTEEGSGGARSLSARSLSREITDLKTLEALQTGNAELVQPADVPSSPSSPRTVRNTLVGIFLGSILGVVLALLLQRMDRRLRASEDFEESFGLPVLTTIPDRRPLTRSEEEMERLLGSDGEAFRMLRTRLRYFNVDRDVRSVLITSPGPGDGKTTVSWNLATSAAGAGLRAILLEADFRRPTIAARQELAPLPGLSESLSGQSKLSSAVQRVAIETRVDGHGNDRNLDVIVAGSEPPNPGELLGSDEMAALLKQLHDAYDLVVIDTPPILLVADAIPLLQLVDGVVVVGRMRKTTRDEANRIQRELLALNAPALGVVANRATARDGDGYGYGYGEYGSEGPVQPRVGPQASTSASGR